ncbi:MAG: hypothetical protein KKG59_05640 [Nanoarchaeota archaeon]|nr:hypothetical protein [Nanoarchaeota archaeon]
MDDYSVLLSAEQKEKYWPDDIPLNSKEFANMVVGAREYDRKAAIAYDKIQELDDLVSDLEVDIYVVETNLWKLTGVHPRTGVPYDPDSTVTLTLEEQFEAYLPCLEEQFLQKYDLPAESDSYASLEDQIARYNATRIQASSQLDDAKSQLEKVRSELDFDRMLWRTKKIQLEGLRNVHPEIREWIVKFEDYIQAGEIIDEMTALIADKKLWYGQPVVQNFVPAILGISQERFSELQFARPELMQLVQKWKEAFHPQPPPEKKPWHKRIFGS